MFQSLKVCAAKVVLYGFLILAGWLVLWGVFSITLDSLDSPVDMNPLAKALSFVVVAYVVGLLAKARTSF
jgi:hypothetical protein